MKKCEYIKCQKEMPIEERKGSIQRWKDSKYCSDTCAYDAMTLKNQTEKDLIPIQKEAMKAFCL